MTDEEIRDSNERATRIWHAVRNCECPYFHVGSCDDAKAELAERYEAMRRLSKAAHVPVGKLVALNPDGTAKVEI